MFIPGKKPFVPPPLSPPPPEDIIAFVENRLDFHPDPIQRLLLTSTSNRVITNCTRQWGKTSVSAAKAVYIAAHVPNSLIVVASPCLRQSGEWLYRAAEMLDRLDIRHSGDGCNTASLVLETNDSRIVGLPDVEARGRGFSPSMVIIDEAARVSEKMYYKTLRPMLSTTNGDLWMLSTPNGKQGFFYDTWEQGGPEWLKVSVPAPDCPRILDAFLAEQRSVMSADDFRQEHMCEFVGAGDALFDRDLIEAAFDDDLDPI